MTTEHETVMVDAMEAALADPAVVREVQNLEGDWVVIENFLQMYGSDSALENYLRVVEDSLLVTPSMTVAFTASVERALRAYGTPKAIACSAMPAFSDRLVVMRFYVVALAVRAGRSYYTQHFKWMCASLMKSASEVQCLTNIIKENQ